jgi:hypothetical protein
MAGLQRILKACGRMVIEGADGDKVVWAWDYAQDRPRIEAEMTAEERKASKDARRGINKSKQG